MSSDCIVSNGRVTGGQLSGVDLKGSGAGLFEKLSLFVWQDQTERRKMSEEIRCPVDI
jgi:hypothetical protein